MFLGILLLGSIWKESSVLIQQKFFLLTPAFIFLALFCNDPHFLITYKFAYGRGWPFVRHFWIALVFVPLGLVILMTTSFFLFRTSTESANVEWLNSFLTNTGTKFQIGRNLTWGAELLSWSLLLMYLTVGWHYAKQTYGCMMAYNQWDNYELSSRDKKLLRWHLLSFAAFQFVWLSRLQDSSHEHTDVRFAEISTSTWGFPFWILWCLAGVVVLGFSLLLGVVLRKGQREKKWPSKQFLIPILALYAWWIPLMKLPEFYFMAVPFFHSMQYLPFALRMEKTQNLARHWSSGRLGLRLLVLLVFGFLAFELIPTTLDQFFLTENLQIAGFFATSFAVFINIHHFFMDSVVWRFHQPEFRMVLNGEFASLQGYASGNVD